MKVVVKQQQVPPPPRTFDIVELTEDEATRLAELIYYHSGALSPIYDALRLYGVREPRQ